MEPDPDMFVDHLVKVFEACRVPLKEEGSLWVNLGDCYAGSGYKHTKGKEVAFSPGTADVETGTQRKSLLGIPFRFALAMIKKGWILRNTVIWHKPNAMPSSAADRFTIDFEYLFLFT